MNAEKIDSVDLTRPIKPRHQLAQYILTANLLFFFSVVFLMSGCGKKLLIHDQISDNRTEERYVVLRSPDKGGSLYQLKGKKWLEKARLPEGYSFRAVSFGPHHSLYAIVEHEQKHSIIRVARGLTWAQPLYAHDGAIADVAFDAMGNFYFSVVDPKQETVRIYTLWSSIDQQVVTNTAQEVASVRWSELGTPLAGDFCFDATGNLFLSTGNTATKEQSPGRIFMVERPLEKGGSPPKLVFKEPAGRIIASLEFTVDNTLCYAGGVKGDGGIFCIDGVWKDSTLLLQSKVYAEMDLDFLCAPLYDLLLVTIRNEANNFIDDDLFAEALADYEDALSEDDLSCTFIELNSAECLADYGTRVDDPDDWEDIRDVLKSVVSQTEAHYIVLLGGPKTIPRGERNVGHSTEPEYEVPTRSDQWYIDFDEDLAADYGLVISRISDVPESTSSPYFVVHGLEVAAKIHRQGGLFLDTGCVEISTHSGAPYQAPPHCLDDDEVCDQAERLTEALESYDCIDFNSHGYSHAFTVFSSGGPEIIHAFQAWSLELDNHNPIIDALTPCSSGSLYREYPTFPVLAEGFIAAGAAAYLGKTSSAGYPVVMRDHLQPDIYDGKRVGDAFFDLLALDVAEWGPTTGAAHLAIYGDPTVARYFYEVHTPDTRASRVDRIRISPRIGAIAQRH